MWIEMQWINITLFYYITSKNFEQLFFSKIMIVFTLQLKWFLTTFGWIYNDERCTSQR